ncbi:MAG: universal stress protein [Burkholderiaceae bacterium]
MYDIARMLVLVDDSNHARNTIGLAAATAARFDARLIAVYTVSPFAGTYLTPEISAAVVEIAREQFALGSERTRQLVEEVARETGHAIDLIDPDGIPQVDVIQRCRYADLVVVGQRDPGEGPRPRSNLSTRLLLTAGRPLLFMPYASASMQCGRRILVAWSDTRESARALHDALPWMKRAESVEIVAIRPADTDVDASLDSVLELLDSHGIAANASQHAGPSPSITERIIAPASVDAAVAEMLLSLAADHRADLMVMGGYGHSRAVEFVLGGVTRTVLQSMTVPVLMSH